MSTDTELLEVFDARAQRREERRDFFRALGLAAAAGAGLTAAGHIGQAQAQAAPTDGDVLNFALNLEYLEAQFYSFAAFGVGLNPTLLTGTGTPGLATGGRQVAFTDPVVAQHAREIAADEIAHVTFLRDAIGATRVAQPAIDISPTGAFSAAARAAGLISGAQVFDPYSSDENFLLGAYIFEDVGVTAYKGASPLITSKVFLEAAAGILAVEAYHAALIRTVLDFKGIATPALIDATEAISNARDGLDGATDLDQGIRPIGNMSNIAPLDGNGLAFSRSPGQVLNIAYLNRAATDRGGFFPAGVNGSVRTSAAN
ncbi:ferritin-like domain-containing protein [Sphingomonas sp.]|uniref:ferritin-like domain-containing protein n=1 Tax=Sphingomonas sp. TaxID=28214 RepID=UPI002EDAE9EA